MKTFVSLLFVIMTASTSVAGEMYCDEDDKDFTLEKTFYGFITRANGLEWTCAIYGHNVTCQEAGGDMMTMHNPLIKQPDVGYWFDLYPEDLEARSLMLCEAPN